MPRDRVPDAGDRAGVGKGQDVFAVGVVAGDLHHRRFDVGVVQVADRNRVGDLGGRIVLGVGDVGAFDRRFDRRVVDGRDVDVARQRVGVDIAIVDGEADRARQCRRIVAGVLIGDAAQRRFVVGQRVAAGQRHRAGDRVPDARDRAGVGERQHVFAIGVVAGDLHHRRFDVGIVQVGDRNRVGDLGGRIVFVVSDVGPFDRRFDRSVVAGRDVDVAGQRVGVDIAIVDREADRSRQAGWIVAGVLIGDAAQSRFVVGQRVAAGQRHACR